MVSIKMAIIQAALRLRVSVRRLELMTFIKGNPIIKICNFIDMFAQWLALAGN